MVSYKRLKDTDGVDRGAVLVTKNGVISTVSNSEDNQDYQAYQAWVADGNTPDPAE